MTQTPRQTVNYAMHTGARTMDELRRITKLPEADIAPALAELVAAGILAEGRWGGWFPLVDLDGKPHDTGLIGIRTTK